MLRKTIKVTIFFWILAIMNISCKQERKTTRAFYYWKSAFTIDGTQKKILTDLQVKKLYIKLFDVTWNQEQEKPVPASKIGFDPNALSWLKQSGTEIIPTISISNETLEKIRLETTNELGERINSLLQNFLGEYGINNIKEIQIDYDWTAASKDKYFELLKYLKMLPLFINRQLSVTIRLYQCKNYNSTGIPPVNRGLLMCYNMGNLKNPETTNSILDAAELKNYINNVNAYPLPLDIALPLFEWNVLFRKNEFSGVITNLPDSFLLNSLLFRNNKNKYELLTDTVLNGYELKKGDILRKETSEFEEILKSTAALSPLLMTPDFTISLYHLDSLPLSKFKKAELETIYNSLH